MSKIKYPTDQTKCIDWCICPYCGHKFDGFHVMNYDLYKTEIYCPICDKEMKISASVEYTCTAIDEE